MTKPTMSGKVKEAVRTSYGRVASRVLRQDDTASCCGPAQPVSCCAPAEAPGGTACTAARLYSAQELADLPDSVTDAALGCGNPTALASLRPGEAVLDLGSGGGIDCLLAAKKVGPEGRVIGLDMTPQMVELGQRNARKVGLDNVEFRQGEIESIPLPDESVDVVISNCVINLSPDKDAVFGEIHRVLRPGGRMLVSDIVLHGGIPAPLRESLDVWAGCLAGALDEADYLARIRAAGLGRVTVLSRDYLSAEWLGEWEDVRALLAEMGVSLSDLDRKVASVRVEAHKEV